MSEPNTPKESSITMTRRDKRDLIMVGVAVIVVVIVVGAILTIPPEEESPGITATIEPNVIELPAGRTVQVVPTVNVTGHLPIGSHWDFEWHVNPYWLGSVEDAESPTTLPEKSKASETTIIFKAGEFNGSGNLTFIATYGEFVAVAIANITVGPPVFEDAVITPSNTQVLLNRSMTFTLVVHDSLGMKVVDFNAGWSASGPPGAEYEMVLLSGQSVKFIFTKLGNATISATVARGQDEIFCNASVEVVAVPPRAADYRWYDMFNVPFGEWWDRRLTVSQGDEILTHSYPFIFRSSRSTTAYVNYYSNMRLNITARNLTEVSMNDRPEFLPHLGERMGGNSVISWYLQYLTSDELHSKYPISVSNMNDGWCIVLNGTVTMDKTAAFSVLPLTEDGFLDFSKWWNATYSSITVNYTDWLRKEAGSSRLDIWPMYQWPLQIIYWGLAAEKVGDKIVLRYDIVTWGMEALMTMWLHEAFLPTEWWFEDMRFNARIGPYASDFDIDAVVAYALKATNSTQTGEPCWMWEGMMQHIVEPDPGPHPMMTSPYDPLNEMYRQMGIYPPPEPMPGSLPIEYTPGSFNLTANETLRFEWPTDDVMFMSFPFMRNWTNFSSAITLGYSEPNQTDMPAGQFILNTTSRYLEFVGPFDFWSWSVNQTVHTYLLDKWDLFRLLPYGMPYLEFWPLS